MPAVDWDSKREGIQGEVTEIFGNSIVVGILTGVVSGLVVALLVARVRLFQPPSATASSSGSSISQRVVVDIRVTESRNARASGPASKRKDDGDDQLIIILALTAAGVAFFATYIDAFVNALLLVAALLGALLVTTIALLLLFRIKLTPSAWSLVMCGAVGAGVGVVSALALAIGSKGRTDLSSADDWLSLAYLLFGFLFASVLIIASVWGLLVVLANASLDLTAPGRPLWEFIARTAPSLWWFYIISLLFGVLAIAFSTGWAYEQVSDRKFSGFAQ